MNKKLIRLTESDLHRIVKESVNKVLSEAINELDPRTYASYADKRAKQAANQEKGSWEQYKLQNKANNGKVAARNAWNKKYSQDNSHNNGFGDRFSSSLSMPYNDYTVRKDDLEQSERDNNYVYGNNEYNPYNDTTHRNFKNYSYGENGQNIKNQQQFDYEGDSARNAIGRYGSKEREATEVAKQMAQGNGKYIKGQGWQ